MKKNYNYNFENRKQSQKSGVSVSGLDVASCTSSSLKKSSVVDGRVWHTTDTNEFYYDWDGKRTKLSLTGDNANLISEINKIKAQIKAMDVETVQNKVNQLETKVNNAASQANTAKQAAQTAQQQAAQAAQAAQDAAAQVTGKADVSYVDDAVSHAFDNLTDAQKEELRGPAGAAGKDGKDGVDGKDGADGKDGVNGQDGAPGKDGIDGKDGADGKDGEDGLSAYDVAVAAGFNGTVEAWLESLKGADGKDGTDGKDGVDGKDGKDGEGITAEDRAKLDAIPDDLVQGSFPDAADVDGSEFTPGLATVQDVIEYVNALIEKKKDELVPSDSKNYFYVNAVKYIDDTTVVQPIYQMNCFEIDDDAALTNDGFIFEGKVDKEILGYNGGADDPATTYTQVLTVDVPNGYSIEVHSWDSFTGEGYSNAAEPMMLNPRGDTRVYGGKTYKSYVRETNDLYDDIVAAPLRYKIIIKKIN